MINPFLAAIFLQFSGIVGAGIFALPFLFVYSNFYLVTFGLIVLGIVTAILDHLYIDVILHTKGDHQLPGYAGIHLNPHYRQLSFLCLLISGLGALFAYILLAVRCLNLLFNFSTGLSTFIFLFLLIIFFVTRFQPLRSIRSFFSLLALLIPCILLSAVIQTPLPPIVTNAPNLAFFGGIVFALSGFTIIPEVEEILRTSGQRHLTYKASLIGLVVAIIVYWLFSFTVVKLSGSFLTTDSFTGLSHVSPFLSRIVAIFGLLITFNAASNFLVIFREILHRDFSLPQPKAILVACCFPFLVLLLKNISYISIISLTGSVTVFLAALIICLIRLKINYSHKLLFLVIFIITILGLGLFSELF